MSQLYYPPVPQVPKKKHTVLWVCLAGAAIVVLALCAVGLLSTNDNKTTDQHIQPTPTTVAKAPAATIPPKAVATHKVVPQIGRGEFEVGKDVAPGKYKTAGAEGGIISLCTYTVTGSGGNYDDFGTLSSTAEPAYVTLKPGQTFESSGCAPWIKQGG